MMYKTLLDYAAFLWVFFQGCLFQNGKIFFYA